MRAVLRNSRASRKGLLASPAFSTPRVLYMVATGQKMVGEKKLFEVREMSGNFILGHGKFEFLRKVREN